MANETQVPRKLTTEEAIALIAQSRQSNSVEVALGRLAYLETLVADVAKSSIVQTIEKYETRERGTFVTVYRCGLCHHTIERLDDMPPHTETDECPHARLMAAVKE